jgi:ribosomal protein S27E
MNVTCPNCEKDTLALGNGDPRCSRCGYTENPVKVANKYIETVLGISPYENQKEGGSWPLSDCPSCDMTTFVDGQAEQTGICFYCGEAEDVSKLAWCEEGGGHYFKQKGDGGVICDSHFNEKVNG